MSESLPVPSTSDGMVPNGSVSNTGLSWNNASNQWVASEPASGFSAEISNTIDISVTSTIIPAHTSGTLVLADGDSNGTQKIITAKRPVGNLLISTSDGTIKLTNFNPCVNLTYSSEMWEHNSIPVRSPSWVPVTEQETTLVGTATGDYFGRHVCISEDGGTMIVTSSGKGNGGFNAYLRVGGAWVAQGDFNEVTGGTGAGVAAAMNSDGSVVVIGSATDNSNRGSVWIFKRTDGVWAQSGSKFAGDVTGSSVEFAISPAMIRQANPITALMPWPIKTGVANRRMSPYPTPRRAGLFV